ncbi:MAG: glycosyltransferase [Bacteroidetes bacterium]|nr:glycosyltransferase [Bacteroidota bacterium]
MGTILNLLQVILIAYLGIGIIYLLFLAIAGLFRRKQVIEESLIKHSFAIFIPAYKEDKVILEVAEDACNQDYPKNLYDVIVIADKLKPETILKLKAMPITVIEVDFEKSTKSKSLNKAFEILPENYDYALILDADNIMETGFVRKLNNGLCHGFFGVQGHRVAKNMNTSVAILDAVSEEINNHLFRRGNRALGLSSSLIGSGMAFEYKPFKTIMAGIEAIGGFDKELELYMTQRELKVDFIEDAYVYDEKVQSFDNFSNQRKRWLAAQFIYLKKSFGSAFIQLFTKGNVDYFNRSFQHIFLPRVLLLGAMSLIFMLSIIFDHSIYTVIWCGLFATICLTLLISIPWKMYNIRTFNAVLYLPKGIWLMFKALISMKGANKTFIHTEHGTINKEK